MLPTQRCAGWKPTLGSANTVQCQVRGCGGEAPARISKHCSVSGLGLVRLGLVRLGLVRVRFGLGLGVRFWLG